MESVGVRDANPGNYPRINRPAVSRAFLLLLGAFTFAGLTGATACVFYKFERPESIGSASIDVRTASGVAKGEQGFARLEIGNFAITLRAAYMHTSSPAEDGLLALDLLRHFKRVTIDFAKSEIDLEDLGHASD